MNIEVLGQSAVTPAVILVEHAHLLDLIVGQLGRAQRDLGCLKLGARVLEQLGEQNARMMLATGAVVSLDD